MRAFYTGSLLLLLLSGCSGWDVTLSEERTPHFRTLAVVSPEERDKDSLAFAVRKRPHQIMAEKTFYQDENLSAAFATGRHREHRWMAGVTLNYAF